MTDLHETLERSAGRVAVLGTGLLVAATATASAQTHGGGGGPMGGQGAFGGWMFLWPVVLIGLLALVIVWTGGRRRSDHTDRTDHALEELRERYARGDLSEEEFERRRRNLQT